MFNLEKIFKKMNNTQKQKTLDKDPRFKSDE